MRLADESFYRFERSGDVFQDGLESALRRSNIFANRLVPCAALMAVAWLTPLAKTSHLSRTPDDRLKVPADEASAYSSSVVPSPEMSLTWNTISAGD